MKKGHLFILFFIFLALVVSLVMVNSTPSNDSPKDVIKNLYDAIDIAKENGNYKCCIEPACTMCYLGHWKFEQGTCFCDEAIANGNFDDVCPECKSGIEKGLCTSTEEEFCEIKK